jgi:hypothetical protein
MLDARTDRDVDADDDEITRERISTLSVTLPASSSSSTATTGDGDEVEDAISAACTELERVSVPAPNKDAKQTARSLCQAFFAARKYLRGTNEWTETWEVPQQEFTPGATEDLVVAAASQALTDVNTASTGQSRWGKTAEKWEQLNKARARLGIACNEWTGRYSGRTVGEFARKCLLLQKPHKVSAGVHFVQIAEVTPGNAWPLMQITRDVLATSSGWTEAIEWYRDAVRSFGSVRTARENQ